MSTRPEPEKVTALTILGATGSIGRAVRDVVMENPGCFQVETVVGGSDAVALARMAVETGARRAVIHNEASLADLRAALSSTGITTAAGDAALCEAAAGQADIVVSAITGTAGLRPTLAAIEAGRTVALANKESLVAAGALMMRRARAGQILALDSEHNAIAQALGGHPLADVLEITLTASGGPFRSWTREQMAQATRADALAHPNFAMGSKISVDSATMMNKGLELIEAHHLFGLPSAQLSVLVHPQQIVHGLVVFRDGSVNAGMAVPDMRVPVAHCLALRARFDAPARKLDLTRLSGLTFEAPDLVRFPALALARRAMEAGGALPIALNAANEIAVAAFLAGRMGFGRIAALSQEICERHAGLAGQTPASIEEVMAIDAEMRRAAEAALSQPAFVAS